MEAHSEPQSAEFVPSVSLLQDGNPRDHQTLPSTRGVGHFAGFQRRLLSCSNKSKVVEVRFHLNSQTYQFTALPFGLLMAPLEFTKVVKEVKLMAQARGISLHQYLNDWLLRAPCRETCQRHTQTLLDLCRDLGGVVNLSKSELIPQQVFNFVGYRFDLSQGLVTPSRRGG